MIYFDNAATTRNKPDCVYDAYNFYVKEIGVSPGRGTYSLAVQASRMLYNARKIVVKFFGATDTENVVFTKNSTEAINLYLNGMLSKGDHILISPYEHNAVLRPLHLLKENNVIEYDVLPEEVIYKNSADIDNYIQPNTKILILTLASNLTGQLVFNRELARIANEKGIVVFVDASQGAGKRLINMHDDYIDVLAFTGHKDLMAMPGVGGLVSIDKIKIRPLIQGGTGIHGEYYINPEIYPESYEAGTLNMPSIWSLKTSLEYIMENHDRLYRQEKELLEYLIRGLETISGIIIYNKKIDRVPTVCFNIEGISTSNLVQYLNQNNICVRGGIHCAILAHKAIGTVESGAVRVSINSFNTFEEIDDFIKILGAV